MIMESWHPRRLTGYGRQPPHPQWPGGARLALQFVLNVEEGAEHTVLNGDEGSESYLPELAGARPLVGQRAYSTESHYDYGARRRLLAHSAAVRVTAACPSPRLRWVGRWS